jgi:hypothetical protein
MPAPRNKRHILPCLRQPASKVASNAAGTKNGKLHIHLLKCWLVISTSLVPNAVRDLARRNLEQSLKIGFLPYGHDVAPLEITI